MVDRSEALNFVSGAPESPGIPERTGSQPLDFLPRPFTTRPRRFYPQRISYATFDPAFTGSQHASGPLPSVSHRANVAIDVPTPTERRAGSEPHTGWRRQNFDVDTRQLSIPPSLEIGLWALRERPPYPNRSIDEITTWMPPPVIEPRSYNSQPTTEGEIKAARPGDASDDWANWREENDPYRTRWIGHDTSRQARYGTVEDPNETAAVPGENMMESIEVESDPLVALRQTIDTSQTIIRRELDRCIALEDDNRALISRVDMLENDIYIYSETNHRIERERQQARDDLALAEEERDLALRQREVASSQAQRLRLQLDEPEEVDDRRHAQQQEYEQAIERLNHLEESEASLRGDLDRETSRIHRLELERDQMETERDQALDQNRTLQDQVTFLITQAHARQALAVLSAADGPSTAPDTGSPPHITPPNISPPPVQLSPPEEALAPAPRSPVGPVARGGRGHGRGGAKGRGARGAASTTRKQPGRHCKVEKNYRM